MTKQEYKEALETFNASHIIDKIYDDFEKRIEKVIFWDNIPQEIKDEFEYFWDKK